MGNGVFDQLYEWNKQDQLLANLLNKPPVEDASHIAPFDGNKDVRHWFLIMAPTTITDSRFVQDTPVSEDGSFQRRSAAPVQDMNTQLHSDDITHPLESTYAKSVSTTQPRATLPVFIHDITLTANKPPMPTIFDDPAASNKEHVSLFDLLNTLPIAGVLYPLMIGGRPHRNTFATTLVKETLAAYLKENPIVPPANKELPQDPRTPNTEATPVLPVQAPMAVDRPRITLPLPQRAPRVLTRKSVRPQSLPVSRSSGISSQPPIIGAPKRKLTEEETSDGSQRIVKSKNDDLARFIMSLPDPPVLCAGQQLLARETFTGFQDFRVLLSVPGVEPPVSPGFVWVNGQDAVDKLKWLKYLLIMNQFKLAAPTKKKTDDRAQGSRNVSALKVETSAPRVNATAPPAGVSLYHQVGVMDAYTMPIIQDLVHWPTSFCYNFLGAENDLYQYCLLTDDSTMSVLLAAFSVLSAAVPIEVELESAYHFRLDEFLLIIRHDSLLKVDKDARRL
ncbi:hypothetical protein BDZ89DRAFT_1042489 [Hymenopellis radicata]|nr:hypothetical protein BDZ89DRAFT_1042489 [Hymenopellis radicata]